ncbi:unnamed protein product, partial [Meganyctiphanes norvegica]
VVLTTAPPRKQQMMVDLLDLLLLTTILTVISGFPHDTVCNTKYGTWWNGVTCGKYAGWTPIHEAAWWGRTEILRELWRRGANPYTTGYRGWELRKEAKQRWCVWHSTVSVCPLVSVDYEKIVDQIDGGCKGLGCAGDLYCVNKRCVKEKCMAIGCGNNAECVLENDEPVCRCMAGFSGHPHWTCHPINTTTEPQAASESAASLAPKENEKDINGKNRVSRSIHNSYLVASDIFHNTVKKLFTGKLITF